MARESVLLVVVIAIILMRISAASPIINEVMPQGVEWVEVYNPFNEDINITEWQIKDNYQTDEITCYNIQGCLEVTNSSFFLVIGRNANITQITNSTVTYFYTDDSLIGNGLSDTADELTFFDSSYSTNMSYSSSEQGKSWALLQNSFVLCPTPTPGTANNCTSEQNQTQNSSTNETQPPASSNPITQSQSTESSLSIIDAPSKASFGETIDVDITAYRGDTAKYAIYLYIKKDSDIVSEKVSLHLDDKLKSYSFVVPLRINPNCDAGYDEGTYDIILEGLDKLALKEVTLKGNAECESEVPKRGKVSYKIDFPDDIELGKEFVVSVEIYNNQNKRQQFSVWSYVYQDNKCLSCGNKTREANAEQAIIYEYESATVFLKNSVYSTDEGVYKLKVKVLQEGYETTKDFTFDIFVKRIPAEENKASSEATAESILNESAINESIEEGKITGKVVYTADKKSPLTTLLLFIVLCLLLLLYFVLKKKPAHNEEREGKKTDTKKEAEAIEEEILKDEDFRGEEPTELSELEKSKEDEIETSSNEGDIKTESEKQENGV